MKIFLLFTLLSVVHSIPLNTEESDFTWISWNSKSGNLPHNSVIGGINPEGRDLYVMRVQSEDGNGHIYGSCGGTDGMSNDDCFVAFEHEEKQVHDVEILTGENFVWCQNKSHEKSPQICRSTTRPDLGTLEVGTIINGKCRFGYLANGKSGVAFKENFEVIKSGSC